MSDRLIAVPPKPKPPLWWRFACALTSRPFASTLARLTLDGYLAESGWVRSVRERSVVTAAGDPLPWMTYPFIEFLTPRLRSDWTVFEYGAGASTVFFAQRVASVVAVEHDDVFAAGLAGRIPANARVQVAVQGSDAYIHALKNSGLRPHIVSVDGRDRVRCVAAAHECLSPDGVLILDDTERAEYEPAGALLKAAGFRRLDFWGFSPGQAERRCTTLFYRADNVLGI